MLLLTDDTKRPEKIFMRGICVGSEVVIEGLNSKGTAELVSNRGVQIIDP